MNNEKFATNGEVLETLIAVEWVAKGASGDSCEQSMGSAFVKFV